MYPHFRNRRIGVALMDEAERLALETGCEMLSVEVFEQNAGALRLYQRLGYQIVEERRRSTRLPSLHGNNRAVNKTYELGSCIQTNPALRYGQHLYIKLFKIVLVGSTFPLYLENTRRPTGRSTRQSSPSEASKAPWTAPVQEPTRERQTH